jgi:hypothetical protein
MEALSPEEVTFALIHAGQPAVAETVVGHMRRAGMTAPAMLASLRAAQHSLLSRGLLDPRSEALREPLRTVVQGMAGATSSIGIRRPGAAMYVYGGPLGTFEQSVCDGVTHTLRQIASPGEALDGALKVLDIRDDHAGTWAEFQLPIDVFDGLKQARDVEVPDDSAKAFAEDLTASTFRGDVVYARHDADGRPRVDAHALVLHGPRRAWLIRPGDAASVTVVPLTPDAFRREIAAFI